MVPNGAHRCRGFLNRMVDRVGDPLGFRGGFLGRSLRWSRSNRNFGGPVGKSREWFRFGLKRMSGA
ncbi:MAG: hypothetical protein AUK55_11255 [Syntrophobacteraceae bacterium CG2_30_61_12]|nr:MAG: hypothetical protein AUK55_11255 [Syntrophobacteraceae bacterium CG2_30_61_12]